MKRYFIAVILVFCCCFIANGDDERKLLPSEANEKIRDEIRIQFKKYREQRKENPNLRLDLNDINRELSEKYLKTVHQTGLSSKENLELATLLRSAGKRQEAQVLYTQLDKGNSYIAYLASTARIHFFDEKEQYQVVENMIKEHQRRFTPSPETSAMCSMAVTGLAAHYVKNENHSKAVELVLSEINRVPEMLDAAYAAPMLLYDFVESFVAVGKRKQLLSLLEDFATRYAKEYEARKDEIPEGDSADKRVMRANIINFNKTARRLQSRITQAKLIGEQAPDFNFTHFFNTEPITLADLKGRVVLIDFWATWCGPCKAGFPFLREFYDGYKEKGFVVLGVTSLQGNLYDGDIKKTNLEPEEEIKLLKEFFVRHKVNWPNVFSDRGPRDPRYGVRGIPTLVVLDKKGVVRFIGHAGGKKELRELVSKLLAE